MVNLRTQLSRGVAFFQQCTVSQIRKAIIYHFFIERERLHLTGKAGQLVRWLWEMLQRVLVMIPI